LSCTTILEPTLPENSATRLDTRLYGGPSTPPGNDAGTGFPAEEERGGFVYRTGPYDEFDPGPWPWHPAPWYRRDTRTGRHRRGEAPDPWPDGEEPLIRPSRPCATRSTKPPQPAVIDRTPRPTPGRSKAPSQTAQSRPAPHGFPAQSFAEEPLPSSEPAPLPRHQEHAWTRFLATTEPFAAAHLRAPNTAPGRFARLRALTGRALAAVFDTRRFSYGA
jgi:hypothetical protein